MDSIAILSAGESWSPFWYDIDSALCNPEATVGECADYRPRRMYLYGEGCRVDNGSLDCTNACQDPESVWTQGMETLHNCLYYPIIARLLQDGNLTAEETRLAEQFNIRADTGSPLYNGWPVIERCLQDYCNEHGRDCGGDEEGYKIRYWSRDGTDNLDEDGHRAADYTTIHVNFTGEICSGIDATINTDIGGIGMFVSYIMQISIVFFAWAGMHYLRQWKSLYVYLRLIYVGFSEEEARQARSDTQDRLESSVETLKTSLFDFHKAQVWFMLAVQLACLISVHNTQSLDVKSYQQFWNNVGVLFNLAFGGMLPVLLALLILRQAGVKDTQTLLVSTACVALAAATWFRTWRLSEDSTEFDIDWSDDPGPESCALVSPMRYCYRENWFMENVTATKRGIGMLVFALFIQFCMVVDQVRVFAAAPDKDGVQIPSPAGQQRQDSFNHIPRLDRQQRQNSFDAFGFWLGRLPAWAWYDNMVKDNRWTRSLGIGTGKTLIKASVRVTVFATEIVLIVLTIVLLQDFARILIPGAGYEVMDPHNWSLGQIIAVAIWVPVIFGFLWRYPENVVSRAVRRLPVPVARPQAPHVDSQATLAYHGLEIADQTRPHFPLARMRSESSRNLLKDEDQIRSDGPV